MSIREDILDQFGEEAFMGLAYRGGGNNNQVAVYGIKSCVRTLKQKTSGAEKRQGIILATTSKLVIRENIPQSS